jgi:hypothetical protein
VGVNLVQLDSTKPAHPGYLETFIQVPAILAPVARFFADTRGIWDSQVVARVNTSSERFGGLRVVMPRTNFVDLKTGLDRIGGSPKSRKWFDAKTSRFYFRFALVRG